MTVILLSHQYGEPFPEKTSAPENFYLFHESARVAVGPVKTGSQRELEGYFRNSGHMRYSGAVKNSFIF